MKTSRLARLLPAVVTMAAVALALQMSWEKLPPPYQTRSVNNGPRVIPRPAGAEVRVPPGFHIEVFADGFERPRFMLLGPSRELLLADSGEPGAVYLLLDNGKQRRKLIGGLDRPYGLAFWKDYLYVAETTSLKRYKYDAKSMRVTSKGEEIVPLHSFGGGHWTRTVLFDREGKKMYLTVGSGSNVSTGEDPMRAAINRYNPDGSGHEIFASGLRNVIGLRWYPGTDTLWAATQERDALGDDLVPDYFTSVKQGGFYGWPYAYIGPHEDPRNKGLRPDLVQKTLVPDVLLGSHVAVLDFIFYTGRQFPKQYQGGAFLAFHGSWNRAQRVGYKVAFIPFQDGKPAGGPQDFVTGWMLAPEKREVWGRPVGLLEMPDGSLLVSDDGGDKIWRVTYK
ncbi:MAG TPA: PQQ-dependent sugar dehydrogenase, partial [Bryobacterales bacterium]|nr:PQQ-dependent sugar dehydrogenase [Bryobacterales bacterium]